MAQGSNLPKVAFSTSSPSGDGKKMHQLVVDGIPATEIHLPCFNEIVVADMEASSQKPARGLEDKEWYIDPQTLKKVYRV